MTSYAVSINPDLDNEKKNWNKPENLRVLTTCISNWSHWNELIS